MVYGSRYTQAPHKNRDDFANLKGMLPYLWEYRGRVMFALFSLVVAKLANVGIPLVLKDIVDTLDKDTVVSVVLPVSLLLAYGVLKLASSLFNELRDAVFTRVRYHAMRRLSTQVLSHLHSLALRYHLERKTGAVSSDLQRGARSVSSILNYMVFSIVPTLVEFTMVSVILLSSYEVMYTVVMMVTVVIYVLFTFSVTNWRMHFRHEMNALESKSSSQSIDSLINYETVKYFGNENMEVQRYDDTLSRWESAAVKSQNSMSALNFGQGAIIAIGVTIIMFMATADVQQGKLSIGDLVLVNAFLLQLFIPLNFLGIVYRQLKHSLADMDLVFKLLNQKGEIQDKDKADDLVCEKARINFEHVNFSYSSDRKILQDISFTIEPGSKLAIVGPSGAGKSTLARLLFRFFDVTEGCILIDGIDIREITQASLRSSIGIVPQDTVLFNETLYYNLAYARPDAELQTIIEAAKIANIHDFISSLPDGYDTMVGERGLKLSGGEKQRVAIARVILKNPKILVLDEATSALDSHSEKLIQSSLKQLAAHHTTLVIAHRLSTIVDADEILVLDAGHIVERGSHQKLLNNGVIYKAMWELQQTEEEEHNYSG